MKRKLTPEEKALWRRTTRNVSPLRSLTRAQLQPPPAKEESGLSGPGGLMRNPAAVTVHSNPTPDLFGAGDPRLDRHARRGRIDIDASFDLHGHNLSSGRFALHNFLIEARRRRNRCVLIITGKGVRSGDGRRGGVLRQAFLNEWLQHEDFHHHIIRVSPAHPRHGGGGAFYVFLKTK